MRRSSRLASVEPAVVRKRTADEETRSSSETPLAPVAAAVVAPFVAVEIQTPAFAVVAKPVVQSKKRRKKGGVDDDDSLEVSIHTHCLPCRRAARSRELKTENTFFFSFAFLSALEASWQ